MSEHSKEPVQSVFCPVLADLVPISTFCVENCPWWDGKQCCHLPGRGRRVLPRLRSRFWLARLFQFRMPRRRGRGLRVPPVREKWPSPHQPETTVEPPPPQDEDSDYGVGGMMEDHPGLLPTAPQEATEGPDLDTAGHGFEVVPDFPDWLGLPPPDLPQVSSTHRLLEGPFPSSPPPDPGGPPLPGLEPKPPIPKEPQDPFSTWDPSP